MKTIIYFKILWFKKAVSYNSYIRSNLNSHMCVIVIIFCKSKEA